MKSIQVYDTTLRDGSQGEKINFSAKDKLRIAQRLDSVGVHYIEGGWPGSNPKDVQFFELAQSVSFKNARLSAFGSTRKPNTSAKKDANIIALLQSETPAVTIFGKSWDLHVKKVLGTPLKENLAMINDSVAHLISRGREVIYDAEHFFDGYKNNPEYATKTIEAAVSGGADWIVLCDTNGGTLPFEIEEIMESICPHIPVKVGIHTHNDSGLAVANTLVAVRAGAVMVQGTVNGYGERCGNADLTTVIPNLQLKMGRSCMTKKNLSHLTELSRDILGVEPGLRSGVQEAERDVDPTPREFQRDGSADPTGPARHDGDLRAKAGGVEERLRLSLRAYFIEESLDGPVHVGIHGGTGYAWTAA